ncbi:MAG: hypothetical protein U0T83_07415 [Bacteriovoracaceae bacterium]
MLANPTTNPGYTPGMIKKDAALGSCSLKVVDHKPSIQNNNSFFIPV